MKLGFIRQKIFICTLQMTKVCKKCGRDKLWMDITNIDDPRSYYLSHAYFCDHCDDIAHKQKYGRKLIKLHPDKRTERSGYSYKEQMRSSVEPAPVPEWEKERLKKKKQRTENKRNVLDTIKEDLAYDGDESEEL